MRDTAPRSAFLAGWLRSVAGPVLYAALAALLWFSSFGAPHVEVLMRHLALGGVLVCGCGLGVATLVMLLPGYPTVKLVCIIAGALYFDLTSGVQFYLIFFPEPKKLILAICAISVAIVALRWAGSQALKRIAKSVPAWMARSDDRQRAVLRATMSTLMWSGALTVWNSIGNQGSNPLTWMRFNLAFVLIFFACECLKYGALSDMAVVGNGPGFTRLSCDELHLIELHLRGEDSSTVPNVTPEACSKMA